MSKLIASLYVNIIEKNDFHNSNTTNTFSKHLGISSIKICGNPLRTIKLKWEKNIWLNMETDIYQRQEDWLGGHYNSPNERC